MTKLLIVDSSTRGADAVSRQLTDALAEAWRSAEPDVEIVRRDVGATPVPHLLPDGYLGVRADAQSEAELAARALSDTLIAEVREADVIVIGSPMYNFGISSTLKAWFDHVLRPRVTFAYSEAGPEGLLKGRRAIVIATRGGVYSEGPMASADAQIPHLKGMLGFVGIEPEFILAEGIGLGPEAAQQAIDAAKVKIEEVVRAATA